MANHLEQIPLNMSAPNKKIFSWKGPLWDSSLLVSISHFGIRLFFAYPRENGDQVYKESAGINLFWGACKNGIVVAKCSDPRAKFWTCTWTLGKSKSTVWPGAPGVLLDPWQVLSRRVLNRTLVYQINSEEAPPGNNQQGLLLEGKPTVQLNRTLGFPD